MPTTTSSTLSTSTIVDLIVSPHKCRGRVVLPVDFVILKGVNGRSGKKKNVKNIRINDKEGRNAHYIRHLHTLIELDSGMLRGKKEAFILSLV